MIAHVVAIVLLLTAWVLILVAPFLVEYGWTLMHRLNREVLLNGFVWFLAGLISSASGLGLLYVGFIAGPKLFIKSLGTELISETADPVAGIFILGMISLFVCFNLSLIRRGGESAKRGIELLFGVIATGIYFHFMNNDPKWIHFSLW